VRTDQVHAIGAQLSYWPIKMKFNIAGRMLWENGARNRFQGQLGTLTATYIF